MLAKVTTCAVVGLEGELVEVEVDISPGLPAFTIVGLPDAAVQEARERVRAAIRNSGYQFPLKRITVNLAPADLRKEGPAYDLPIALGILLASEQVQAPVEGRLFLGELALDGKVRSSHGILAMVSLARERGLATVYVPAGNAKEAALIDGLSIYPVDELGQLAGHLQGAVEIPALVGGLTPLGNGEEPQYEVDFCHIKGQEHVKRALEVAAAGGHNVIMKGPPGSGKTLLARAIPSILPPLTPEEALEVTRIYSVSGLLPTASPLLARRPFRSPHHTISHAGLVGGGRQPRPGEISLSHRGVLFLDELPEFGHAILEVLWQPMEDRMVTISRAQGSVTFPSNFMLLGAMNPCPCGFHGDSTKACTCPPSLISRYQRRLSGPLLDRVDIFADVPRVDYEKLADNTLGEPSAAVRRRVAVARAYQQERCHGTRIRCNAEMTPAQVRDFCQSRLEDSTRDLLRLAVGQLALSARAFHRVLKVARTIADLAGSETMSTAHVAEALQYRQRGPG